MGKSGEAAWVAFPSSRFSREKLQHAIKGCLFGPRQRLFGLGLGIYAAITATKVRPVTGLNDLKSIRRVIGARNIVMFALSQIGFACLAALRAAQCFSPPFFHLEDVGMEPENFKSGHSQILLGH